MQVCLIDAKGCNTGISAFEWGRMVGLREAGLSYHDIAACTGHAAPTVMRVWNQWREEGHTQGRAGTGPSNVTTARDDHHLICMAMTDIHSVESTLEYCNGFGPLCFNSSSLSCEGWTSGLHAIASASIVHRPPAPQTAMGM